MQNNNCTKSVFSFLTIVVLILVALFYSFTSVYAQGTAGVGIRPATFNEKMNPSEVKQLTIQLNNLSGVDQTFYLSKRDIAGVREGGVPIFATERSEKTGYEISEWITLDRTEIFIPANGSDTVSFVLTVPETVSPGSHFGGIIVSVEPPEMSASGASIGYEVANIISIRIAGDAIEGAMIRQFSTSQYIYGSTNVEFEARIENEGNTLVTPIGPLEIHNMFGKRVGQIDFNDSGASVYPKTAQSNGLRTYTAAWEEAGVGFGRYEAVLTLTYGEDGRKNNMSSTVTFWILPMNIIGPALGVLAVLLIIIYIFVRLYVKRSMAIMTSGSTRRLVRSRQQSQFPVLLLIVSMLAMTTLFLIVLLLIFA
jgi:Bacterial protein of unknown function (DUF916)